MKKPLACVTQPFLCEAGRMLCLLILQFCTSCRLPLCKETSIFFSMGHKRHPLSVSRGNLVRPACFVFSLIKSSWIHDKSTPKFLLLELAQSDLLPGKLSSLVQEIPKPRRVSSAPDFVCFQHYTLPSRHLLFTPV